MAIGNSIIISRLIVYKHKQQCLFTFLQYVFFFFFFFFLFFVVFFLQKLPALQKDLNLYAFAVFVNVVYIRKTLNKIKIYGVVSILDYDI